jgi:hypothetical protein
MSVESYFNDGFEFKGFKFRPLTAGSMLILERIKSDFLGDSPGVKGILEYLFVHGEDREVVKGLSRDLPAFESAVEEWAEQWTMKDLNDLTTLLGAETKKVEDASVTVLGDSAGKKP